MTFLFYFDYKKKYITELRQKITLYQTKTICNDATLEITICL